MSGKSLWLWISVLIAVIGCASPEQRAAQERQQATEMALQAARIRTAMENKCKGYGFKQGTSEYANCLMQMDQRVQNTLAAKKAKDDQSSKCEMARAQAMSAPTRTGNFFESLENGNIAYERCMAGMPPTAPSKPVQLNCRKEGLNQVNCYGQ